MKKAVKKELKKELEEQPKPGKTLQAVEESIANLTEKLGKLSVRLTSTP